LSQSIFRQEWRTQSRRKRRFYAVYMTWLERVGYTITAILLAGFVGCFFYQVDEWITAEGVEVISQGGQLVVEASLAGKSVAKAQSGQFAELANFRVQGDDDTILRLTTTEAVDETGYTSRLLASSARDVLSEALVGKTVQAREDVPLKVTGIQSIEIDAKVAAKPSAEAGEQLDPDRERKATGQVVSGMHTMQAQLGDLPPRVQDSLRAALKERLVGRAVAVDSVSGGANVAIEDLLDAHAVVKLEAGGGVAEGSALRVAPLKRGFDARIALDRVDPVIAELVETALANGHKVTANVRVRTGSKPIAYFLLRRS
jgi:hypothetical protein